MNRIINKEYIEYSGTPFFMSIRFVYQDTIKINPPTDDFLMADFIFVILHFTE